jgi:hypothetical protein
MKRGIIRLFLSIIISLFIISFTTCDFSPYEGEATISIDLQELLHSGSGADDSDTARIAGVPGSIDPYIVSITITISGPGVNKVQRTYAKGVRYITINVPPGSDRTIKVDLNLSSTSPLAVLVYSGEATIDLKAGQIAKVSLFMQPSRTKLVIPDCRNNRIVQIDNISGAGWYPRTIGGAAQFLPYDIDFDSMGRIYIANYLDGNPNLIILNGISDAAPITVDTADQVVAVAVDRLNNILYLCNGGELWWARIEDLINLLAPPLSQKDL